MTTGTSDENIDPQLRGGETAISSKTTSVSATPLGQSSNGQDNSRSNPANSGATTNTDGQNGDERSGNSNQQQAEKRNASAANLDDDDDIDNIPDDDAVAWDANPKATKKGTVKTKCEDSPFYEESMKEFWTQCRNLQRVGMLIHMNKANRAKIINFIMSQWQGTTPGETPRQIEKKRGWATKEAFNKYDQNYSTWKSLTLKAAKKRMQDLNKVNKIFETLKEQKQITKFFRERWDSGVGFDEFIEIFHFVKDSYNIRESSPCAKAWCKNIYVCVMNMVKMQREIMKKYKGRPPLDENGRHDWDDEDLATIWRDMTEGNWKNRPSFKDFAQVYKAVRTRNNSKRAKIDPKLNPKIYNPESDEEEEAEETGEYGGDY